MNLTGINMATFGRELKNLCVSDCTNLKVIEDKESIIFKRLKELKGFKEHEKQVGNHFNIIREVQEEGRIRAAAPIFRAAALASEPRLQKSELQRQAMRRTSAAALAISAAALLEPKPQRHSASSQAPQR